MALMPDARMRMTDLRRVPQIRVAWAYVMFAKSPPWPAVPPTDPVTVRRGDVCPGDVWPPVGGVTVVDDGDEAETEAVD